MLNAQLKPYQAIMKASKKYDEDDQLDLLEVAILIKNGDAYSAEKVAMGLDTLLREECFEAKEIEVPDDENPKFTFSLTNSKILAAIVNGAVDARELAWKELRNRGLDATGKWVGFQEGNCKKPF